VPNGLTNGATTPGRTVVEVNGEGGQQPVKKNAVLGLKEKKIEDHKRSTTPYMTKYERARVLGTRALQIRCVVEGILVDKGLCGSTPVTKGMLLDQVTDSTTRLA